MELPSDTVALDRDNPWPGLDYFDERSAGLFHGRDAEISGLLHRVIGSPVTVLFGKSGLGKTSLLRAGLFPQLRAGNFLPIYVRFDVTATDRPLIRQLQDRLFAELREAAADFPAADDEESLWEYLHREGLELWSEHNRRLTPVFVLDQFEELFTLGAGNPARIEQLRIELGDLMENRIPRALVRLRESGVAQRGLDLHGHRYRAIVSLREDFLAELEGSAWADAMPSLLQKENRMPLRPMSPAQAFQAVHGSAPNLVDEALGRKIVRFVSSAPQPQAERMSLRGETVSLGTNTTFAPAGSEVEPALLSLLCRELNEARKQSGKERIDEEIFEKSKTTIISNYYHKSIADLPPAAGRFIEDKLITQQGFRNNYPVDDAIAEGLVTEEQIALLVNRRILRLEERYGTRRVELTHDLLTPSVRQRRSERQHNEQMQEERHRHQQERDRLDAENREQRRLKRWAVALAIVSLGLMSWAIEQRRAAQRERDDKEKALVASASTRAVSKSTLFMDPVFGVPREVAVLLALAGDRLQPGADSTRGLLNAYQKLADVHSVWLQSAGATGVAFSPDGTQLATGSWDGKVRLWEVASGRQLAELPGHGGHVTSVTFSPDHATLASADSEGTIQLWSLADRQALGPPLPGHSKRVSSLKFSPDGRLLASGSVDGTVLLWDVGARQSMGAALQGRQGEVHGVAFSPDGGTVASGGFDGTVVLWDVASRSRLDALPRGNPAGDPPADRDAEHRKDQARIFGVAFTADGRLAAASFDNTVTLWNVATRRETGKLVSADGKAHLISIDLDPKANLLAASSLEGPITLWDVASGESRVLPGQGLPAFSVAFSPDGRTLASSGADRTVVLWDAVRPAAAGARPQQRRFAPLAASAFSPDGATLAFAGSDNAVVLWDVRAGQALPDPLRGHSGRVLSVAFSPDGSRLASGGENGEVILWDAAARRAIGELHGHETGVGLIAFSQDGQTLASAAGRSVILWEVAARRPRGEALAHTADITSLAFSPKDATLVVGAKDGTLTPWDARRGVRTHEPLQASHGGGVTALAFNPDASILVSGFNGGTISAWQASDWKVPEQPLGETRGRVQGVWFGSSGKSFVSVSGGHTVLLWDTASLQSLGALVDPHEARFDTAALKPDGAALATIAGGQSVTLWDTDPAAWRRTLCGKLRRNLTRSEWATFIGDGVDYQPQCPDLPWPTR